MIWRLSNRADPHALMLADRHYSRQKPGTRQFVAPGGCIVLLSVCGRALWVSLRQRIVKHAWPGAWACALFRNEGAGLASDLIAQALAATRSIGGNPPPAGVITFVDPDMVRRKRDPGLCFLRAGFRVVGATRKGLIVLQMPALQVPAPIAPLGQQFTFGGAA